MFYVSSMMPMEMLMGVREICHPNSRMEGLGQDPVTGAAIGGSVLPIVSAIQTITGTSPAQELQKEQLKLYHAQLLEQKREAAQASAEQQAQDLAAPSRSLRRSQVIAMYAIGGVAAIATIGILMHTMRKRNK
jgi:hypothetical protein